MALTIREATAADGSTLAQIIREIKWNQLVSRESPEQTQERVTELLSLSLADESHAIYLAETDEGEAVGYVNVHWLPYLMMPGPEGFISEIFIIETARGQGIGTQMLELIKQVAIDRGCFRLSLLNKRDIESYQREFYTKDGWQERDQIANFVYHLLEQI